MMIVISSVILKKMFTNAITENKSDNNEKSQKALMAYGYLTNDARKLLTPFSK